MFPDLLEGQLARVSEADLGVGSRKESRGKVVSKDREHRNKGKSGRKNEKDANTS